VAAAETMTERPGPASTILDNGYGRGRSQSNEGDRPIQRSLLHGPVPTGVEHQNMGYI